MRPNATYLFSFVFFVLFATHPTYACSGQNNSYFCAEVVYSSVVDDGVVVSVKVTNSSDTGLFMSLTETSSYVRLASSLLSGSAVCEPSKIAGIASSMGRTFVDQGDSVLLNHIYNCNGSSSGTSILSTNILIYQTEKHNSNRFSTTISPPPFLIGE